jgi:hypothetical protein
MCDGTHESGWECECAFSSDDTTVATVDSACPSGGTGMAPGGTNFRGTAVDVPGPNCGDQTLYAACPVTVITVSFQKQDGSSLPSTLKVGISATLLDGTTVHDRTQHLQALVTPHASVSQVTLTASSQLTMSVTSTDATSGLIKFDIVGKTQSQDRGDATIWRQRHSSRSDRMFDHNDFCFSTHN